VPLEEPAWWYGPQPSTFAHMLRPLGRLYGWAAKYRYERGKPYRGTLPVICVGNLVAGGTGKTPLTLVVADELLRLGRRPAILTRGYGGGQHGPHWVAAGKDTAAAVGDEALLLASRHPTLVARDRAAGARAIEAAMPRDSAIVMDDGLQNPTLAKDLRLAIVDGRRGFGNGEVLPAGPLRAPLDFQFGLVDAIVVNHPPSVHDDATSEVTDWLRQNFPGPVLEAGVRAAHDADWLKGARIVAFAGIANPQRFFDLLAALGADLAATVAFRDHHPFSERDAERLLALAAAHDALPVTTQKDRVRLNGTTGRRGELWHHCRALEIRLVIREPDTSRLTALLEAALVHSDRR
jgi:tetraacyldisaccharide 4'-kinase